MLNELNEKYAIITFHGSKEVYVQNFISIMEISESIIKIKTPTQILYFEGNELVINYMDSNELVICGCIEELHIKEVIIA